MIRLISLSVLYIYASFFALAGDLYARDRDLDINARVSTGYDDNITFAHEGVLSDSVTDVSVGLDYNNEGRNRRLKIGGSLSRQLFASYGEFNNNSQDINFEYAQDLSKHDRFTLSNAFLHSEEPSSFEDVFGRTAGRYAYFKNDFDFKYEKDISKKLLMGVFYGNRNYQVDKAGLSDSALNSAGLDANYFLNSATNLLAGYEFTSAAFEPGGNASINTVLAGVRRYLTKQLSFIAQTGFTYVSGLSGSDSTDPAVFLSLINEINETATASLTFEKTSTPSVSTADIFNSWQATLRFTRQVLERLWLTFTGYRGEGEFETLGITDTQSGLQSRLDYDMGKDWTAFVSYSYTDLDSDTELRSYQRNFIGIGMRVDF